MEVYELSDKFPIEWTVLSSDDAIADKGHKENENENTEERNHWWTTTENRTKKNENTEGRNINDGQPKNITLTQN